MGRSYLFECSRCGYRAKVAGRLDRGLNFFVQTIACRDCKELYDAVTRVKIPDEPEAGVRRNFFGCLRPKSWSPRKTSSGPPTFESVLNRLDYKGVKRFRWVHFKPQCPVSPIHRIQIWNEPVKCPRCGLYLEKNALPYRIWE